uniref:Uncharacterized protein n=1 Tax=Arcella intermedia TaxID=1963864 RepID=A0A6B2LVE8_9EUKA
MLQNRINDIIVVHFQLFGILVFSYPLAIVQESNRIRSDSLSITIGVHQLLQLSGPLNLEIDLTAILRHYSKIDVIR